MADASDITELAQCYGLSLGHATARVSIVPATGEVAQHLGIAAGEPLLIGLAERPAVDPGSQLAKPLS